jgi:hypothetical protein
MRPTRITVTRRDYRTGMTELRERDGDRAIAFSRIPNGLRYTSAQAPGAKHYLGLDLDWRVHGLDSLSLVTNKYLSETGQLSTTIIRLTS